MALKFPPIYLLKSHFERDLDELHRLEKEINIVWDIREAKIVLGKVRSKIRAAFDLRKLGLNTEEVVGGSKTTSQPAKKRRKVNEATIKGKEIVPLDSDTRSDEEDPTTPDMQLSDDSIKVLKLAWYVDSVAAGKILPIKDYLVYEARIISTPKSHATTVQVPKSTPNLIKTVASSTTSLPPFNGRHRKPDSHNTSSSGRPPHLIHQTTSEHEVQSKLPKIPDYLHTIYSCQRPTPLHCPNDTFLAQLRIIKKARDLTGEAISLRAYNSAIATIASYPYTIVSSAEVSRLPNCGNKIAELWQEWNDVGHIKEVDEIEADPHLKILDIFYGIHDVGEATAREFYNKGWQDLDDVVQYGWGSLSKTQKIGVKYYEEFKLRIPREEVEKIAGIILQTANKINEGFQLVICGGYRRGKPDSGDVDVILSHPDEEVTDKFLDPLLENLESDRWITNRLKTSTANSARGQITKAWKRTKGTPRSAFDTLDHSFVVWQDTGWHTKEEDLKTDPAAKNPNPHRRVDIIISPWKTAGCAVVGWTGGTMFERDLRRYCREKLNMKFDSSGVRKLDDGTWVDLEKGDGDLFVKEKRVFAGLGLEWREPTERCTD